jgi:hypothetical protein
MADHHQISISINLAGITDRIQRHLKTSMSLVAIGLNATQGITAEDLHLPDVTTYQDFDSSNPWTIEQASAAWQTWVLQNGFRDIAEAISGLLEEVQRVLTYWHLAKIQHSRVLQGDDWNKMVVNRESKFHRFGLPEKIDFLKNKYGLNIDEALVQQVLSINAARNCLVHRDGVVSTQDARNGVQLNIEWSALAVFVVENDVEKEIELPYRVEAGGQVGIATRRRAKSIAVGQPITVTTMEFSQMCWTLFIFAQACAQTLETLGRAQGIQFQSDASTS